MLLCRALDPLRATLFAPFLEPPREPIGVPFLARALEEESPLGVRVFEDRAFVRVNSRAKIIDLVELFAWRSLACGNSPVISCYRTSCRAG